MNKSELTKRVHATAKKLQESNPHVKYHEHLKKAWEFWNDKMKNQQFGITLKVKELEKRKSAILVQFQVTQFGIHIETWLPLSKVSERSTNAITIPLWLYNDRVRKNAPRTAQAQA